MGLKDVPSETLVRWFQTLSFSFGNAEVDADSNFVNLDRFEAGDRIKEEIIATVDPLLDHWSDNPDHSLMSHWLHDGMPEGQLRDRAEIYPNIYVFLLGALQEPGHVMTTTLAGLFTRPDQLKRVIEDPSLIPGAINDGARWVAPIWCAPVKVASRDITIGGAELAPVSAADHPTRSGPVDELLGLHLPRAAGTARPVESLIFERPGSETTRAAIVSTARWTVQRTVAKNLRTSSTNNPGCSNAAKCPPRGIVVQCVML